MEWVSNDWKNPNYEILQLPDGNSISIESQKEWRSQFIIGDPQPIQGKNTVESLKADGLIGLYKEV